MSKLQATTTNRVTMGKDHIIRSVFRGDQTPQTLQTSIEQAVILSAPLIAADKPVLFLADIRHIGNHTAASRLTGLRARAQLPFWRIAIIAKPDENKDILVISKKLTAMSGRKKEIHYFATVPPALRWLHQHAISRF